MTKKSSEGTGRGLAVGLTGGIGCGKSEVGRILGGMGVPVLDTDDVARSVLAKGQPAFDRVVERFGRGILRPDGNVDRRVLGDRVFARKDEREALNALVHPPVLDEVKTWLRGKAEGPMAAVVIVPLLYEIEFTDPWNAVICVAADEKHVLARLKAQGFSEKDVRQRMAAQWPLDEKMRRANYVIHNNGSLDDLRTETEQVWSRILKKE